MHAQCAGEWHPHHITERYGLFTLIVLGESLLASANAIIDALDKVESLGPLIAISVLTLVVTASLWWIYFWPPHQRAITSFGRSLRYGYTHYFVFGAAASFSAGIEVELDVLTGKSHLSSIAASLTVTIPIAIFLLAVWWIAIRENADRVVNTVVPSGAVLVLLDPVLPIPVTLTALVLVGIVVVLVLRPPVASSRIDKAQIGQSLLIGSSATLRTRNSPSRRRQIMSIPEPTQTPDGPAYEGRLLDRRDEEIVDQGAAFDIRTLVTRRGVLGLAGVGLGAVVLAACAPPASVGSASPTPTATSGASAGDAASVGEIPDETAGPYPGDGSNGPDVLEDSGIVRQDIRSSIDGGATAEGVPLTFALQVIDLANGGVPFPGVAVYAWHCTAQGEYSMYSSGLEDVTYLRGVQVADADGRVSCTSVFPGCYSGRWPHIHFEVYPDVGSITDSSAAIATSQLALPEAACAAVYAEAAYDGSARNLSQITLASDNVFGDDSGVLQVAAVTGSVQDGYSATLVVGVDTATTPAAGGGQGGSGGGSQPPSS